MSRLKTMAAASRQDASPPSQENIRSRLRERMSEISRGEMVDLPVLGTVFIQMIPHRYEVEIEAATYRYMRSLDMDSPAFARSIAQERNIRVLAHAVRCHDDIAKPIGPLEDWQEYVDDDVIASALVKYRDIRARIDPFAAPDLEQEEIDELFEIVKKNDRGQLIAQGASTLSDFLLSGALRQLIFPSPASSTSSPPSETGSDSSTDSRPEEK